MQCRVVTSKLTDVSEVHQGALMMEAVCTSEKSVNFNVTTWCYIPEDSKLHTCCHQNLKSHMCQIYFDNYEENIIFTYCDVTGDYKVDFLFKNARWIRFTL
jgi:hypothetical protein